MNLITLLGRLTKDVESTTTQSGTAIAKFSIAVNRRYKKDGEATADFFNVTAFGKVAEFISKYMSKGQQIALEGRLQNNNWTDKDGNKRYDTQIIADACYFADGKREQQGQQQEQSDWSEDMNNDELPF